MLTSTTAYASTPTLGQAAHHISLQRSCQAQLEQGQIGLTGSLEQYEAGVKHLKRCYELLERAEKKIEVLSGRDDDGNPQTTPFSDIEADSLAEKADRRSQRRSARGQKSAQPPKPAGEDNVDVPGGLF